MGFALAIAARIGLVAQCAVIAVRVAHIARPRIRIPTGTDVDAAADGTPVGPLTGQEAAVDIVRAIVDEERGTVELWGQLVVLLPVFLLLAMMIRSDSAGPVLYLQERVGKNGRLFRLWKFRTMHTDADKLQAITVGKRDPRITRVGTFLRKYKLDELPQLVNVLMGEMSFVGPRPELKKFVDLYTAEQKQVIGVKPGITDCASIQFRNENELLE